ncbi:MAG TPA: hypothetical protein VMU51_29940 [Mycobacteriales bacterium]|nr:hypothetical protein [Mycobacteriales bacterium]
MTEPARETDVAADQNRPAPWTAPRLARLDAAATANGGIAGDDGADAAAS